MWRAASTWPSRDRLSQRGAGSGKDAHQVDAWAGFGCAVGGEVRMRISAEGLVRRNEDSEASAEEQQPAADSA
jgi:hypothetical protein